MNQGLSGTFKVLGLRVDWLEYSYRGDVDWETIEALQEAKELAQRKEEPTPYVVLDKTFYVQARGRGLYKWVLRHRHFEMLVTDAERLPAVMVRLTSLGLAVHGHEALYDESLSLVRSAFGIATPLLSRIDLAVDVQGWEPTDAEMEGMRCPSPNVQVIRSGGEGRTYSWGKRPLMLRVYNKSAQIAAKPAYGWWRDVWRKAGGFHDEQAVWRIEFEIARGKLRDLAGMDEPSDASGRLRELLAYCLEWAELRVPADEDTNKSRWETHPLWEFLRLQEADCEPVGKALRVPRPITYEQALRRFKSSVVVAAAETEVDSYWDVVRVLTTDMERSMEAEEETFEDLVLQRRRKLEWDF